VIPFQLIEYLPQETEVIVWQALINRVGYFYNMLVQTSAYESYQKYMSSLVKSFYLKLDWDENLVVGTWTERYNCIFEVIFF
jgi:hypothetical protein